MTDYYKPKRINIKNLIPLVPYLRRGESITYHKESGYTTAPLSRGRINQKAKFIDSAETYVEVTSRIEKCGLDGLLLEMAYSQGSSDIDNDRFSIEQHIANALHIDINEVDRRIQDALKYASNLEKKRTYQQFRNHLKGGS